VTYYRRNLPHWLPEGSSIFLTWRLYGSLPKSFFNRLRECKNFSSDEEFRQTDEHLDRADSGPLWLKNPRIAKCVVEKITRGDAELSHYTVHAYVVMANDVHMLLTPNVPLRRITNGLKGATARAANLILRRTGQPFWQEESYDHWCRNAAEFERLRSYIVQNSVTARLVANPEDWPWSSAHRRATTTTGRAGCSSAGQWCPHD
jgi:REP-associated tyrosine transposase